MQWTAGGVQGAWRRVNRLWDEFDSQPTAIPAGGGEEPAAVALIRATHRLVKAVTGAIEGFRFNTASSPGSTNSSPSCGLCRPKAPRQRFCARGPRPCRPWRG